MTGNTARYAQSSSFYLPVPYKTPCQPRTCPLSSFGMSSPPSPNQPHLSTNTSIMKKSSRRGRQPRKSLVNASLHHSIVEFAHRIGSPPLYSDFRDFAGWNQKISGAQYEPAWRQLAQDVLRAAHEIGSSRLSDLKRDVIFDIMPLVVKKKPHETDKLVSTNARRQLINNKTSRHPTLMTLLEMHIDQLNSLSSRSSGAGSSSMAMAHGMTMSSSSMGVHAPPRGFQSSASDSRKNDRGSSSGSSSRSGDRHAVKTSGAMEIATLLSGEGSSSGAGSSSHNKLPSFTQLDAHIQARKEKEKRDKRYRR